MDTNKLFEYWSCCCRASYISVENDGDYAVKREDDTVFLCFQWSSSVEDWKNNFDFPATPYKDMQIEWKCHRGFLRVWKSIEPYIEPIIRDETVRKFIIIGYSHGAAVAALAHEYVWFNRPDLRENGLEGYGFGSPRVYWGTTIKEELKERWKNFYPIRNCEDIVTHVPLTIMGFKHVGNLICIGNDEYADRKFKLKCLDAHRSVNYTFSLTQQNN